jgi:hypothetical protein
VEQERAVEEVAAGSQLLDAGEDDVALRFENGLVGVGIQLAGR